MRISRTEYYGNYNHNHNKNNVKGMLNILNNVIWNGSRQVNYNWYFVDNDMILKDDVVNGLNNYFLSVGPKLAAQIPDSVTSEEKNGDFIKNDPDSVFITAVEESEIVDTNSTSQITGLSLCLHIRVYM